MLGSHTSHKTRNMPASDECESDPTTSQDSCLQTYRDWQQHIVNAKSFIDYNTTLHYITLPYIITCIYMTV